MARPVSLRHKRGNLAWWLALVEVKKPAAGVLFAEEVEGAFAWAAARARSCGEAGVLIRQLFAGHGYAFGGFESLFETTLDEIADYDGLLAERIAGAADEPRCARGALSFFAAEAEA